MKIRTHENPEVDMTPMIDCVFQLIIFFMVIMAIAVVYGVAIKFPSSGGEGPKKRTQEKVIRVNVAQDRIYGGPDGQVTVADGVLKINGEEIPLTDGVLGHYEEWDGQREKGFDALQYKMQKLVDEGFKTDVLYIQGDMKSYHGKIMRVIDRGKRVKLPEKTKDEATGQVVNKYGIEGFSLVPPQ